MIQLLQMHQLVNEHVLAHEIGHRHQPPVQTDMRLRRARPPAPSLIPHADARDPQPVHGRQTVQFLSELISCARPEFFPLFRRKCGRGVALALRRPVALPLDPRPLLVGKILCLTFRSPPRYGHTHTAVGTNTNDIAPRAGVTDKVQNEGRGQRGLII